MSKLTVDPEDAGYVCTLSPASLSRAISELNEDPKQRLGAVQTLRQWIKQQQHLTFRTDTEFLLKVLRTAKFSQLRSREIIETMLTWRMKYPQLLLDVDCQDPAILHHIKRGSIIPLPKPDKEGRFITLMRLSGLDLNDPRITPAVEVRASIAVELAMKENNEDIIVNGEILVMDLTGMSAKHLTRAMDSDKNIHKMFQECHLGRLKGIHFYNGGTLFEAMMAIFRPFMKKKYLERMSVHSTMESLYKLVPMELWPEDYLPDDYNGPSAGPLNALVDNLVKKLMDAKFRDRLLEYTNERYKIDVKQVASLPRPESFRKLNLEDD